MKTFYPKWQAWLLIGVMFLAPIVLTAAVTQLDLTSQVKNQLPAVNGGTGDSTLTAHGVLLGEGTGNVAFAGPSSTAGYVLTSNGASSDPTFQAAAAAPNDYQETPSGSINGSNTAFTLAHTPSAATNVNLFLNGVQQRQGAGNDYTISGATITYLTAPPTGATLNAIYF